MQKPLSEDFVRSVVEEVMQNLRSGPNGPTTSPSSTTTSCSCNGKLGVFPDANSAAAAARVAFGQLRTKGIEGRVKVVEIVKSICTEKTREWGELEFAETGIGRLDHKIAKLEGIQGLPSVEWLRPYGMSGDHGISMEENTPFGVVGAITPVTHSIPTLACQEIMEFPWKKTRPSA